MTVLGKLLQPVWEISSEPIVVTGNEPDPNDRKILYVNRAFTRVSGFAREEAVGRPPDFLHGRETDPNSVRTSEEQLRSGLPQEYQLLLYRKDGSDFHAYITRAPLVDVDGKSEYLIAMYKIIAQPGSTETLSDARRAGSVPLTLPMPLYELSVAHYPQHLTSHPELDALKALWLEIRGKRALPERRDFDLEIMKRWASHLSIAIVIPPDRFLFRLFGTELTRVYGRDLTGSFLDELTPHDLWSVIIQHYREVVKTQQPLYAPISVSNGRWYTEISRLLLPLSGNGTVNFIMGADYKRERF
jgi:PAS domain S-box-containing protein